MGTQHEQTAPAPLPAGERGPQLYWLAVSAAEAELIMDSFKVSAPVTRALVLKVAALVLEIAASGQVSWAEAHLHATGETRVAGERLALWHEQHKRPAEGAS